MFLQLFISKICKTNQGLLLNSLIVGSGVAKRKFLSTDEELKQHNFLILKLTYSVAIPI